MQVRIDDERKVVQREVSEMLLDLREREQIERQMIVRFVWIIRRCFRGWVLFVLTGVRSLRSFGTNDSNDRSGLVMRFKWLKRRSSHSLVLRSRMSAFIDNDWCFVFSNVMIGDKVSGSMTYNHSFILRVGLDGRYKIRHPQPQYTSIRCSQERSLNMIVYFQNRQAVPST